MFSETKAKKGAAKKDLNFLEEKRKVYVPADVYEHLKTMVVDDCKFLSQNGIIDYSLLVGVHDKEEEISKNKEA